MHRITLTKRTGSDAVLTIPISEIGVSNSAYVINLAQIASNSYNIVRWWYDGLNIYAFVRNAVNGTIVADTEISVRVYYIE